MIGIVNYGSGNVQALANIYHRLGIPCAVASTPHDIESAERLVLPGVGAFGEVAAGLHRSGLREALEHAALRERKPVLGICVGMQLLARESEESASGGREGLGWIPGTVRKFVHADFTAPTHLPHMGWNMVVPVKDAPLFADIDLEAGFYFLHSYHFVCDSTADEYGSTVYGNRFTAAVNRGNIYGVQFHPEKSHKAGTRLLENFALRIRT